MENETMSVPMDYWTIEEVAAYRRISRRTLEMCHLCKPDFPRPLPRADGGKRVWSAKRIREHFAAEDMRENHPSRRAS